MAPLGVSSFAQNGFLKPKTIAYRKLIGSTNFGQNFTQISF